MLGIGESRDAGNWGVEGCWELGESNDAGNWGVEGVLGGLSEF